MPKSGLAGRCAPLKTAPGNGSVAERAAILARLRAADEHAAPVVDMDRLAATQRLHDAIDDMTATRQIGLDLRRDRRLELQLAVEGEAARRVGRLLRIQALVEQAGDQRRVAGRLIVPAHDA